jgi:1,2-diacylglycerol 3-beta-galactosyltransferase
MHLADLFIGKPGPGSISEAVAMGLPMVVESNAWTLPQERYNAEWVSENKVGIVLASFRAIDIAVRALLTGDMLARYRANARALRNRAVFEIPDMLARILEKRV